MMRSAPFHLVVTSDKEGADSVFQREPADADVVISQPFWPAYPTQERIVAAPFDVHLHYTDKRRLVRVDT